MPSREKLGTLVAALRVLPVALFLGASVRAGDWRNSGGTPRRDGHTVETGPDAASIQWNGGRPSIIAWNPTTLDRRVFLVRQTGFPPGGEPNGSPVVAQDIDTGSELWPAQIPYNPGDWTTWIAGASDGKVYASRSGNGSSVSGLLYALDAATGGIAWTSQDPIDAGPYDGVVFAPNGDLLIASFRTIWRIRASDGTTAWSASRLCSVGGNCGGTIFGNAVYVADAVPGGHAIKRYDLATGAFQYQGPTMPGFTLQNTPMTGPDGTIYLSRTQNNAAVDFFYAFHDDGTQLTEKWHVPAAWSTSSEFGVGPDGSVYHLAPGYVLHRLDPATGSTLDVSIPVVGGGVTSAAPHLAVDALGRVFVSNGNFSDGRLFSFEPDLSLRWSVAVTNVNIGGPAIGVDGTLVLAGVGTDVRAYRTQRFPTLCGTDGETATPCPCGNAGEEHHGCANSLPLSGGAVLVGAGTTSPDTVVLDAGGMKPTALHIFLQGDATISAGTPFGDGVRCAGGHLLRLATRHAVAGASRFPGAGDPSITARAAALGFPIASGDSRTYQAYYRDPNPIFCPPPAGSTFNATNAVQVTW